MVFLCLSMEDTDLLEGGKVVFVACIIAALCAPSPGFVMGKQLSVLLVPSSLHIWGFGLQNRTCCKIIFGVSTRVKMHE